MKKIADVLFSPYLMGSLIILFAVSIAVATFIENDYGSAAARASVYNARWFELLLLFLVINVTGMIFRLKLFKRKKFSVFLFHIAFLIILAGAALTRYVGFEGVMHIREGSETNQILSQNIFFTVRTSDKTEEGFYRKDTRLSGYSNRNFSETVKLDGQKYQFSLDEVLFNAIEAPIPDPNGGPVIQLVAFGREFQQNVLIRSGETKDIQGINISFNREDFTEGIHIRLEDTVLTIQFPEDAITNSMKGRQEKQLKKNISHPFEKREIYLIGGIQLVLNEFYERATTKWIATPQATHSSGKDIFVFSVTANGVTTKANVISRINQPGTETAVDMNGTSLYLSYGKILITLPFSIRLEDFQMERYPGSNSPSSFASEVTLIDEENNVEEPFEIYMNKILKHKGFRFYQSSYDPDEAGTILSVNHDFIGTFITYTGYFILVFGILWSIFNRQSRLRIIARKNTNNPGNHTVTLLILLLGLFFVSAGSASAQTSEMVPIEDKVIANKHFKKFGGLLVQDNKGRIEPVNTLASDIMRKVTKEEKFMGYQPTQIFLGMLTDPGYWQNVPLIKIGNANLATALGVKGKYGSLMDFVDMTKRGEYKIRDFVNEAYSKTPGERDKFDKEVIAVDERVNICYMIFTGTILDIFPAPGDENNTWYSPDDAYLHVPQSDSLFIREIPQLYFQAVMESVKSDDWELTEEYLDAMQTYQYRNASVELPARSKVKLEIFYNNFNLFRKLFPFYSLLGLMLLALMILKILSPRLNVKSYITFLIILLTIGFVAHTINLGIRWYVSGHAPWSNGYESMIYVAWATMLAGFIFARKSLITLAATSILASLTLLVAHLSWMNPEITNLVPVLKSYWLTFHVSIITASYGFLGLGALLGLLNLILMWLKNSGNRDRMDTQILELTRINEMTLVLGLYFLTIGTILGAVWANESWGRYWGWDPKETWSLITILVYTFILHMRQIPGLNNTYSFNLSALVGFGSVLMTYFGVNYYLSGLHSYAGGDPVPVPSFVYFILIAIFLIAAFAYRKARKFEPRATIGE